MRDIAQRDLCIQIKKDFKSFNRGIKGLKLEKEMVEPSYLLVENIFGGSCNPPS
jgi:hypothetical protein